MPKAGVSKQATQERREKVWQMRVVERKTYRQIARELGTTVFTAHDDAKWVAQHRVKALEGKDRELVANQNEIYEELLNKWLPLALSNVDEIETQLYATDRVTKILSEQAKLFGFHTLPRAQQGQAEALGKGMMHGVIEAMAQFAEKSKGGKVIDAEVIEQPKLEDAEKN